MSNGSGCDDIGTPLQWKESDKNELLEGTKSLFFFLLCWADHHFSSRPSPHLTTASMKFLSEQRRHIITNWSRQPTIARLGGTMEVLLIYRLDQAVDFEKPTLPFSREASLCQPVVPVLNSDELHTVQPQSLHSVPPGHIPAHHLRRVV